MHDQYPQDDASSDRVIALGPDLPAIPERLLLAHARGEVLFIAGAGISQPAGLPDFGGLVLKVYSRLDIPLHGVLQQVPSDADDELCRRSGLTSQQSAEVRRFCAREYDVVLGMLERRMEGRAHNKSLVRQAVAEELRCPDTRPARIHQTLMRLADRGTATAIATTNFDLLLEATARAARSPIQTYALGGVPRPSRRADFAGVLHIHGALDPNPARVSDLILTDQDFGEFYLRRRIVPDFIYDAARLYHLVLVGYSANDLPMRYLLNAVAADGSRFGDLKERFSFVGVPSPDPVALEEWKGRGITPIPYPDTDRHLALGKCLERWAALSAINGKRQLFDAEIRRLVRRPRAETGDVDRDLFEHLVRRGNADERARISALATAQKAHVSWLDAIMVICSEVAPVRRS